MNPSKGAPLAIVTGASSGIGYALAHRCAGAGYDLLIAADEPQIHEAALRLSETGVSVQAVQADLATREGVDTLLDAVGSRRVRALLANAGHGLGGAFLDQRFHDAQHVVDTNITGTMYLLHHIGRAMRVDGDGRILITGSIAGFTPGAYQAVYNATKAFIDSFAAALRNELKDNGVSVTCLMPGITDTHFFARANMLDTQYGASPGKADPAEVARIGFEAMMNGEADVVAGLRNKLQVALAKVTPSQIAAEQHRKGAQPGSARPVQMHS